MKSYETLVKFEISSDTYKARGIEFGYCKAIQSVKRRLRYRLKSSKLKENDLVHIIVKDGSGYLDSCPELDPFYYNKSITVKEYLQH